MLEVALAQVEGLDTPHVSCAVIQRLLHALRGKRPAALLCYAAAHFDHARLLQDIGRTFPGVPLAGCTTCGEFSTDLGFSEDSVILLAFVSDRLRFAAGLGRKLRINPGLSAQMALDRCIDRLGAMPSLCLAFVEGVPGMAERAVQDLSMLLGPQTPLLGAVPGQLADVPGSVRLFCGNEVEQDAVSLLCAAGPAAVSTGISHSWRPIGETAMVTEAYGHKVQHIGEHAALDFYRHYLGPHAIPSWQYPLAVYADPPPASPDAKHPPQTSKNFYIRSPYELDEETGGISFAAAVPAGALVGITEVTPERILEDIPNALRHTSYPFKGAPCAALAFSCVARKDILGLRARLELEALRASLPEGLPIVGFYSLGEIGPTEQGRTSHLHNCTMLVLLLGKHGYHAGYALAAPALHDEEDHCALAVSEESIETLRQQTRFLEFKLQRSQAARQRVELARDMDTALLRTVNQKLQQVTDQLKLSEEKYRRIVETSSEGFVLMDQNMVIQYANDAYCQLTGHSRDYLLGKKPSDLLTKKYRFYERAQRNGLMGNEHRRVEAAILHADGHEIPVLAHVNTLKNTSGELLGHMAFITDLTEQKKALLLAGELQQSLMPASTPDIPGLDLAGRSQACGEVGGDFFDYLECDDIKDSLVITVADIQGHGVDAALLMSAARAFLRMRASQPGNLEQIVMEMNRHMARDLYASGRFLTLLCVCLSPGRNNLTCVRAGHDPALLYNPANDVFEEMPCFGIPLGVDLDARYTSHTRYNVPRGTVLVMGTDGIWEAHNSQGEMFGKNRLRQVIRKQARQPASVILEAVFTAVEDFTRGVRVEDDRTLVVAKLHGDSATGKKN